MHCHHQLSTNTMFFLSLFVMTGVSVCHFDVQIYRYAEGADLFVGNVSHLAQVQHGTEHDLFAIQLHCCALLLRSWPLTVRAP